MSQRNYEQIHGQGTRDFWAGHARLLSPAIARSLYGRRVIPVKNDADTQNDDGWVEGHRAGYAKGRDDGIGIGFGDAKVRSFATLDGLADAKALSPTAIKIIRDALSMTLGKRS